MAQRVTAAGQAYHALGLEIAPHPRDQLAYGAITAGEVMERWCNPKYFAGVLVVNTMG